MTNTEQVYMMELENMSTVKNHSLRHKDYRIKDSEVQEIILSYTTIFTSQTST